LNCLYVPYAHNVVEIVLWAQDVQLGFVCACVADRLAGAQEALQAAKQVAAEQDRDISQIKQDLQQHRCVQEARPGVRWALWAS
jgi:hypothetical protein